MPGKDRKTVHGVADCSARESGPEEGRVYNLYSTDFCILSVTLRMHYFCDIEDFLNVRNV